MEQDLLALVKRLETVALKLEKSAQGGAASAGKYHHYVITLSNYFRH